MKVSGILSTGTANITMSDPAPAHPGKIKAPFPSTDQKSWYAIYVRSRHELTISDLLTQKGIANLVPVVDEIRQWSDRRKKVTVPLIRGYVFVNIDISREKFVVLQNEGVVKFIGTKGVPSIIPEHEIRWLNLLTTHSDTARYENSLKVGQNVIVIAGPFKGIRGQIVEIRNTTRLLISFESISQVVSIEISPEYLKKIS